MKTIIEIAYESGMNRILDEHASEYGNGVFESTEYPELNTQYPELEAFAELVRADEREACAKVCDEQGKGRKALEHYAALTYAGATNGCAAAIRARGNT